MAEFMKEHDNRQHEQKWNEVTEEARANRPDTGHETLKHVALAALEMFLPIRLAKP
jgi:hypothetical protein